MLLSAFGATHPGSRLSNEDVSLVDGELGLFVVADGMGGHNAGEVAAGLAVEAIARALRREGTRTGAGLERALRVANASILESAGQRPECVGMGTTVAAVLAVESPAGPDAASAQPFAVASVGDSRVYRWRGGRLEQLTRDDSWVSQLFPEDCPGSEQARERHPMRHVLTEVVGVRPNLEPSFEMFDLLPGEAFLLCSDGLHGVLSNDRLVACFEPGEVNTIAIRLVNEAVGRGANDNVTAVVVRRES